MRAAVVIAAFGLLAAVTLPAHSTSSSPAARSSEADRVKNVLLAQAHLFRLGRFRESYTTHYTPRFRERCPWARYLRRQRFGRSVTGRSFAVRNLRVRFLSPTQAYLAYRYVRPDGTVVAEVRFVDRDLYSKIGTRWLDDWARSRDC